MPVGCPVMVHSAVGFVWNARGVEIDGVLLAHAQVSTQWRKVQDRLEDDERCSRLDKLDRLEVFQVCSWQRSI